MSTDGVKPTPTKKGFSSYVGAPEDVKVEISTRSWFVWYRIRSAPRRLYSFFSFHTHHFQQFHIPETLRQWRNFWTTRSWAKQTRHMALFKQSPLEPQSIRIFRLFQGEGNDILRGEIYQRCLDDDTLDYAAVSYAWGDPTPRHPLVINDQKFLIAENLKDCLLALRFEERSISLWIDALCINQATDSAGLQERAQQISIMNQIFAKCRNTVIHLGRVSGPSNRLHMRLANYVTRGDELKVPTPLEQSTLIPFETSAKDRPDLYDQYFWLMLADLIELPYFNRMWCLQEYIFAKNPSFILNGELTTVDLVKGIRVACGHQSWAWKLHRYMTPTSVGRRLKGISSSSSVLVSTIKAREDAREQYQKHIDQTIANILYFSQDHLVTDPRDRIYALHGLLSDRIRQELTVNYEETAEALEERVTRLFIQHGYGVLVLLYAGGIAKGTKSWVIPLCSQRHLSQRTSLADFAVSIGSVPDNQHSFENIPITYRACGLTQGQIRFDQTSENLLVSGYVHDTIVALSPQRGILPEENFKDPMKYLVYFWCKTTYEWFASTFPKEDQDDRLWQTWVLEKINKYELFSTLNIEDKEYFQRLQSGYTCLVYHFDHMKDKDIAEFEDQMAPLFMPLLHRVLARMQGRKLARTRRGRLAAVPETTEVGDKIAVCMGVPAPLLLRKTSQAYSLVGPCFVHGLMRGEALKDPGWKVEAIEIGHREN